MKKRQRDADATTVKSAKQLRRERREREQKGRARDPGLATLVESEQEQYTKDVADKIKKPREMRTIKVVANRTYFDGLRRWRRGSTVTLDVEVVKGKPKMPKWAVTPEAWAEIRAQEEEDAKNTRSPIRGGVKGVPL